MPCNEASLREVVCAQVRLTAKAGAAKPRSHLLSLDGPASPSTAQNFKVGPGTMMQHWLGSKHSISVWC